MNVCATGHRPPKLGGYDWNSEINKDILTRLETGLKLVFTINKDIKILKLKTGGALGIDQMMFEVAYKLKEEGYPIELELCVPFRKQSAKWFGEDLKRYKHHLGIADKVTYVDELKDYRNPNEIVGEYYPRKLQKRNEYMVDDSNLVLSYWDGSKGGTFNCIQYAIGKEIPVINLKTGEVF